MNTLVFVAAHDPNSHLPIGIPDGYKILQVGTACSTNKFGDYQDNTGDNISNKNPNYCELTGLYWAWKNSDAEVIGLCHYRRFLMLSADHCLPQYFLDPKTIEEILRSNDVILPLQFTEEMTLKDFYENGKENKRNELIVLRNVIVDLYPDYIEEFDNFFSGHRDSRCNVMIMRREKIDSYCRWLFDILFEMEKRIDLSEYDSVDARIYGYLSERLLNIYVRKNKLKIFYCHMETVKPRWKYQIKCKLDKVGLLMLVRKMPFFKTKY